MRFYVLTVSIFFFILFSCKKDEAFKYDLDVLTGTKWGIPQIEELGQGITSYDQSSPTIFYDDGTVVFGNKHEDFWRVHTSSSIIVESKSQEWDFIALSDSIMHVQKFKFPSGKFILRCVYRPIEPSE